MNDKEYAIEDTKTFEIVFLVLTCPDNWFDVNLSIDKDGIKLIQSNMEKAFGKTFAELFDDYYTTWNNWLENSGEDIAKYINKDIRAALKELKPNSEFDKKAIVLAAKYIYLKTKEIIKNNPNDFIIQLDSTHKLIISEQAFFHIVHGHYLRHGEITLVNRNKSLFNTEFKDLINIIETISKSLVENYNFQIGKQALDVSFKNENYKLVLTYSGTDLEIITFYVIDRPNDISALASKTLTKLDQVVSIYMD